MKNEQPVDLLQYKVSKLGAGSVDESLLDSTLTPRGRYRALVRLQNRNPSGAVNGSGEPPVNIVPDLETVENRIRVRGILMGRGLGRELPPVS